MHSLNQSHMTCACDAHIDVMYMACMHHMTTVCMMTSDQGCSVMLMQFNWLIDWLMCTNHQSQHDIWLMNELWWRDWWLMEWTVEDEWIDDDSSGCNDTWVSECKDCLVLLLTRDGNNFIISTEVVKGLICGVTYRSNIILSIVQQDSSNGMGCMNPDIMLHWLIDDAWPCTIKCDWLIDTWLMDDHWCMY